MNHDRYEDDYILGILRSVKTIALTGASPNPARPSSRKIPVPGAAARTARLQRQNRAARVRGGAIPQARAAAGREVGPGRSRAAKRQPDLDDPAHTTSAEECDAVIAKLEPSPPPALRPTLPIKGAVMSAATPLPLLRWGGSDRRSGVRRLSVSRT